MSKRKAAQKALVTLINIDEIESGSPNTDEVDFLI